MFSNHRQNDDDSSSIQTKFKKMDLKTSYNVDEFSDISSKHHNKLPSSIWTKQEDILLLKLSQSKLKSKWKKISKIIGNKTSSQCSYRFKHLSQSKIDPESPETSEMLNMKILLSEKNNTEKTSQHHSQHNREHNNGQDTQYTKTNADRKNRKLSVKITNVTKLFGVVKNEGINPKFVYDSGIRLSFVADYFEVFLPVYSNLGWEIGQKGNDEKVRFIVTLDLNTLIRLFTREWY